MLPQFGLRHVGEEVVLGIQRIIAQELEHVAMPLVGAGLGNNAHRSAGGESALRVRIVAGHLEFLRGVRIRHGRRQTTPGIHGVGAVQCVVNVALPLSADRGCGRRRKAHKGLIEAGVARIDRIDSAGSDIDQAGRIAAIQRQFRDGLLADGFTNGSTLGGDQFGIGFHVNRLRDLSYVQSQVNIDEGFCGQLNARMLSGRKPSAVAVTS